MRPREKSRSPSARRFYLSSAAISSLSSSNVTYTVEFTSTAGAPLFSLVCRESNNSCGPRASRVEIASETSSQLDLASSNSVCAWAALPAA